MKYEHEHVRTGYDKKAWEHKYEGFKILACDFQ